MHIVQCDMKTYITMAVIDDTDQKCRKIEPYTLLTKVRLNILLEFSFVQYKLWASNDDEEIYTSL